MNFFWIYDIAIAVATIGLFEGLIKPLLAYQTQRLARKYLPNLFDRLDPVMPAYIANKSPREIEELIFQTALGLGADRFEALDLVEEFDRAYSPLANAQNTVKD